MMKKGKQHNTYPTLLLQHSDDDSGKIPFYFIHLLKLPLTNSVTFINSQCFLNNGIGIDLQHRKQSVPVALAVQTGGAIRVVLDFFVSFCVKAKRKIKNHSLVKKMKSCNH